MVGVRVSDTTAETTMAMLRVTENSRKRRPTMPPMSSSGMKTASSETVMDTMRLVRAGVRLDSRDKHGRTPLHLVAALFFLEDVMRLLLDRKADPNTRDDEGLTPLHFAVGDAREEISRMLISAGADVNATDIRGRPPLHHIPFRNDVHELTVMLLEKGANPRLTDRLGRTALHAVCNVRDEDRLRADGHEIDAACGQLRLKTERALAEAGPKDHSHEPHTP